MISNNDFNGAHKWNLGGLGHEKTAKRAPSQWAECASPASHYMYGARDKGSCWELLFQTAGDCLGCSSQGRPRFKTQTGLFGEELCLQGSPHVNRMFN